MCGTTVLGVATRRTSSHVRLTACYYTATQRLMWRPRRYGIDNPHVWEQLLHLQKFLSFRALPSRLGQPCNHSSSPVFQVTATCHHHVRLHWRSLARTYPFAEDWFGFQPSFCGEKHFHLPWNLNTNPQQLETSLAYLRCFAPQSWPAAKTLGGVRHGLLSLWGEVHAQPVFACHGHGLMPSSSFCMSQIVLRCHVACASLQDCGTADSKVGLPASRGWSEPTGA